MADFADPGFGWRGPIAVVEDGADLPATTLRVPVGGSSRARLRVKLASGTGNVDVSLGRGTTETIYGVPAAVSVPLSTAEATWESDQLFGESYVYLVITGTGVVEYFDLVQL